MNRSERILCILLMLPAALSLTAQQVSDSTAADTLRAQQLRELVVQGSRVRIEGEKIVFVPDARERKHSNSAPSLIQVMNIPFLIVDNGAMIGRGNRPVTVFINSEPASEADLAAFWPSDVLAVEYIENPVDPIFGGVEVAVNFVMRRYIIGGVAKFDALQIISNSGQYTAAVKTAYKRMSYGLMVKGGYTSENVGGTYGVDSYRDLFYNGQFYDNIERYYSRRSEFRDRNVEAAFVAKYNAPGLRAEHQLAFNRNRSPLSTSSSNEEWSPGIYSDIEARNITGRRATALQASGSYFARFSPKWSLWADWFYGYNPGKGSAHYILGDESDIFNEYNDKVHSLTFRAVPSFQPSDKFFAQFRLHGSVSWFDTRYGGNTSADISGHDSDIRIGLRNCWMPVDHFWIDLTPAVFFTRQCQQGITTYSKAFPWLNLEFYWGLGEKASLRGGAAISAASAPASSTAGVSVRMSDLLAYEGNPELRNTRTQGADLRFSWLPSNRFTVSVMSTFNHVSGAYYSLILPAGIETGGLVMRPENGPASNEFELSASVSARLLNGAFSLNVRPAYNYMNYDGSSSPDLSQFMFEASANYSFKGVMASLFYNSRRNFMSAAGTSRYRRPGSWAFSLGYGTGNLYVNVRAENLFCKYRYSRSHFYTPVYITDMHAAQLGRKVSISVSYTFGFGKRVNTDFEFNGVTPVNRSVVGQDW